VKPVEPVGPVKPVEPVLPVGPMGPVGPLPVGPVGPGFPVGPGGQNLGGPQLSDPAISSIISSEGVEQIKKFISPRKTRKKIAIRFISFIKKI
jgi:hypothetical protein